VNNVELNLNDDTSVRLLVERGTSLDAIDPIFEESLLHKCARHRYQSAGLFLIALHLTSQFGLERLTRALLQHRANPNIQTYPLMTNVTDEETIAVGLQTPVHRAIYTAQEKLLHLYIDQPEQSIVADFNLKDEHGQSAFSLALWMNMLNVAKKLLTVGRSDLHVRDVEQTPLLAQAISRENVPAALFLLEQPVDVNELTHGCRPIQLAVQYHLPSVVEALCRHGAMMNVIDENGNSVLWNALDSGQEDIASILVKFGCDSTQ
jgi:rabankyrin-5